MRIHGDKIEFPDGTEQFTASSGSGVEAQPAVAFDMVRNSAQTIPNASTTYVSFNEARIDTNGIVELATTDGTGLRITKETAGLWNLSASIRWEQGVVRGLTSIRINGDIVYLGETSYNTTGTPTSTATGVAKLEEGDFVQIVATHYTGSSININGSDNGTVTFSGHMVSSITEGSVVEKEAVVVNVTNSVKQTLPAGTWTHLSSIANIKIDTENFYKDAKFTPQVAGYYEITTTVMRVGTSGRISAGFGLNSTTTRYSQGTFVAEGAFTSQHTNIVYLNGVDDYVVPMAYSSIESETNTGNCWFNAHLITGQSSGGGSDVDTTTATVDTAIGMVAPFAMDSVPTGWLHCDGSEVSRDTYSLLYSKVGDTYGNGDGSTTFNLPDLQDEFIRGSSDTLAVGSKQDDEFKAHLHDLKLSYNPVYSNTSGTVGVEGGGMTGRGIGGSLTNGDANYGMFKTGGSETRPRNVAMLYCINATAEPSSGGGDYTPEKFEWSEDLSASGSGERLPETVYTNTRDVPIYVQLSAYSTDPSGNILAYIDGKFFGRNGVSGASVTFDTPLFIVPSGSTYEFREDNGSKIQRWMEARMPIALGTGGKTVAFRGTLNVNQPLTGSEIWTKVNLNTTTVDTDNSLDAGTFKPSVAGWYQVNGNVSIINATQIATGIYKNGVVYSKGTNVNGSLYAASASDVVYLNGTTDYLELYVQASTPSALEINGDRSYTYLSAVLVSGAKGEKGEDGESIWTDVDGDAVLETDGKKLTLDANVAELGAKARITTDTNSLEFKVGSGDLPDVTLTDTGMTTVSDMVVNLHTLGRGSGNHANSTAFGYGSLSKATGDQNTAVGYYTLNVNTSGRNNTALGSQTLAKNLTGNCNTGLGDSALNSLTTGGGNTMIGYQAGFTLVSGSNNICIGKGAQPSSSTVSNEATIGDANVTKVRMGNGTSLTTTFDVDIAIDKKLAIKDKLIEKLSARLDKLEKRMK